MSVVNIKADINCHYFNVHYLIKKIDKNLFFMYNNVNNTSFLRILRLQQVKKVTKC